MTVYVVTVPGKTEPVRIYEAMGRAGTIPTIAGVCVGFAGTYPLVCHLMVA